MEKHHQLKIADIGYNFLPSRYIQVNLFKQFNYNLTIFNVTQKKNTIQDTLMSGSMFVYNVKNCAVDCILPLKCTSIYK